MKKLIFTILLMSFLSLTGTGCGVKPDSQGNWDEIIVFCDSLDWQEFKEPMNAIFGREYQTPVFEREYVLSRVPIEQFGQYQHSKNIFFLGRLNSDAPVSQQVKNLLPEESLEGFQTGEYFFIPKKDVWAFDQYVAFFVAPTREDMVQRIYDLGNLAYQDFEDSYYRRLKEEMFARYENKELEEYIASHFPFTMRVQHDYFVAHESLEENFIWLRRINPDRSLLIHWVPYSDTMSINAEWVIKQRNRIAGMIYEGDVVVAEETRVNRIQFKDRNGIRLTGTWKNPDLVIGGPFRNITFIDRELNRVYMIDFYVQAVGQRKKIFLDQLEIMAYTLQPKEVNDKQPVSYKSD